MEIIQLIGRITNVEMNTGNVLRKARPQLIIELLLWPFVLTSKQLLLLPQQTSNCYLLFVPDCPVHNLSFVTVTRVEILFFLLKLTTCYDLPCSHEGKRLSSSPVSVVKFALHRKYGGANPKANYIFMRSVKTSDRFLETERFRVYRNSNLVFYLWYSGYCLS